MSTELIALPQKIANISYNFFEKLPKTGKPKTSEWTVLSTIIQQKLTNGGLRVVALGTGTKCVGVEKMSDRGDVLNDSHAEVICRRAFLRYLLEQIKKSVNDSSEIFFFNNKIRKCLLKENIYFHFFTTQVPCGDAAIFPENNSEDFGEYLKEQQKDKAKVEDSDDTPPNKRLKTDKISLNNIHITGAKCLSEKDVQELKLRYVNSNIVGVVRTKPGRGSPTLSVSCSDKLAKWCHLGVQGALITLLVKEPIYFKSFTIAGGTPFNKDATLRAFYDRFSKDFQTEVSLEIRRMEIVQTSQTFRFCRKENKQPCPNSIIWSETTFRPLEVAVEGKRQGITKSKKETKAARLQICKMEIFRFFMTIVSEFNLLNDKSSFEKMQYVEMKLLAEEYRKKWMHLRQNGFKAWTNKDPKLLKFTVD